MYCTCDANWVELHAVPFPGLYGPGLHNEQEYIEFSGVFLNELVFPGMF